MASIVRRTRIVTLPDGSKATRKARVYSVRYFDAAGQRRWARGYTDKGATVQMAAKLEAAVARGEQGMVDPFKAHAARPIADHAAEWMADLEASGRNDKYRQVVAARLDIVVAGCRWSTLRDVDAASFTAWRARVRTEPGPAPASRPRGRPPFRPGP